MQHRHPNFLLSHILQSFSSLSLLPNCSILKTTNLMRSHTQVSYIRLKRTFVTTLAREKFISLGPRNDTKKIKFDPTDTVWKSEINLNENITRALEGMEPQKAYYGSRINSFASRLTDNILSHHTELLEKERNSGDIFKQRAYQNAINV